MDIRLGRGEQYEGRRWCRVKGGVRRRWWRDADVMRVLMRWAGVHRTVKGVHAKGCTIGLDVALSMRGMLG